MRYEVNAVIHVPVVFLLHCMSTNAKSLLLQNSCCSEEAKQHKARWALAPKCSLGTILKSKEQKCRTTPSKTPRCCNCSALWHVHRTKNVKTLASYLLGLLAMIKCSICSYQCDNWYVSNWRLACHIIFAWGGCQLGLPSAPQMLPWHGTLLWATHPHG